MLRVLVKAIIQIYKILLGWCLVLVLLPYLSLFYLYKQCVVLVARAQGLVVTESCVTFATVRKVAYNDQVEHEYERKPLCNVGVYADLGQGNIELNKLIQKIQTALIDKERATGYKLRSYWVRFGGYTFYKINPDFKTSDHVHKIKLPPGEDILKFLNIWMTEPYTPKTAMWRVLVVDSGYTEYLAIKIYHGIGDGLTLNEFAISIFDSRHHHQVQKLFKGTSKGVPVMSDTRTDKVHAFIEAPAVIREGMVKQKTIPDPFQVTQGIEVEQFSSVQPFNILDIKSIAKKQGVSFMAILISIYGNAIGKYLDTHRNTSLDSLLVGTGQPWPDRPENFIGNHLNLMSTLVPLNVTSALVSLNQVQAQITNFYSSRRFIINKYMLNIHSIFPLCILRKTFKNSAAAKCTASPMLAVNEYTYNGLPVNLCSPLGGVAFTTMGMLSVPLSQNDKVSWLVVGAKDIFKTQENLDLLTHKYMKEEFDRLLQESNEEDFVFTHAP